MRYVQMPLTFSDCSLCSSEKQEIIKETSLICSKISCTNERREKQQLNICMSFMDEDDGIKDLTNLSQFFIKDHGIINSKWSCHYKVSKFTVGPWNVKVG